MRVQHDQRYRVRRFTHWNPKEGSGWEVVDGDRNDRQMIWFRSRSEAQVYAAKLNDSEHGGK